jgi:Cu+-exporting ATPase
MSPTFLCWQWRRCCSPGWVGFLGPRRSSLALLADAVQSVAVTERGGYSPDVIRVREGVPVELIFDRQEF